LIQKKKKLSNKKKHAIFRSTYTRICIRLLASSAFSFVFIFALQKADISTNLARNHDYSFYLFSLDSNFRAFFVRLVARHYFKKFIFHIICLSCLSMALERPNIEPESWERQLLVASNYAFTLVFTVEMLFKVGR